MRVSQELSDAIIEKGIPPKMFFFLVSLNKLTQAHLDNFRYMELSLVRWEYYFQDNMYLVKL